MMGRWGSSPLTWCSGGQNLAVDDVIGTVGPGRPSDRTYDPRWAATSDAIKMWASCTLCGARSGATFGERPMPTSDVAVGMSPDTRPVSPIEVTREEKQP